MKDLTQLLEALDAKCRAATPGPWSAVSDLPDWGVATMNQSDFHPDIVVTKNRAYRAPWRKNLGCSEQDAAYIAALDPATVGALIDCVRAAIETRSRADDYADSYISRPVRDALAALAARLGGGK